MSEVWSALGIKDSLEDAITEFLLTGEGKIRERFTKKFLEQKQSLSLKKPQSQ